MLATWWVWPTFSARLISAMRRSMRSSTGRAASSHGRSGVGGVAVTSVMSVGLHEDLGGGLGVRAAGAVRRRSREQVGRPDGCTRTAVGVGQRSEAELAPVHGDAADTVALRP